MSDRVVRGEKPDLIVRDNGKIEVDLDTISQDTFEEMEETARILRESKKKKSK